ncbi:MAG TPA: hypothetical protein PLF13_00150 [candidate division Zixibacteria bacterium]|nr:hypothetical protein [candidate division Zixibacteria bacterium]
MSHIFNRTTAAAILTIILLTCSAFPCTSFRLTTDNSLYYVHSLNQGNSASVPGLVFVNPRGEVKQGFAWSDLTRVNETPTVSLIWRSQYGSITFSPFGKELPDGGMNEAGLFVWEMSFDTEYPGDSLCPTLFQTQWMQYLLDNYHSVTEVITHIDHINLDGWGWHYFLADRSGATAIVDFIAGSPVIYTGAEMPVPLCCNSIYPEALEWLRQYEGFGGDLEIHQVHEEIPRFIYGAKLLADYDKQDPVEYSFHVLDEMSSNVRWSVVFDVVRSTVYFRTNVSPEIRFFSFGPEDFAPGSDLLILDVNDPEQGDVRASLIPFRSERNDSLLADIFGLLCDMDDGFRKYLIEDQNTDLSTLAHVIDTRMENISSEALEIAGRWTGTITTAEKADSISVDLTLDSERNILTGIITIGADRSELSNLRFQGGFLTFTVAATDPALVSRYQLHLSGEGLCGRRSEISSDSTAAVNLRKQ